MWQCNKQQPNWWPRNNIGKYNGVTINNTKQATNNTNDQQPTTSKPKQQQQWPMTEPKCKKQQEEQMQQCDNQNPTRNRKNNNDEEQEMNNNNDQQPTESEQQPTTRNIVHVDGCACVKTIGGVCKHKQTLLLTPQHLMKLLTQACHSHCLHLRRNILLIPLPSHIQTERTHGASISLQCVHHRWKRTSQNCQTCLCSPTPWQQLHPTKMMLKVIWEKKPSNHCPLWSKKENQALWTMQFSPLPKEHPKWLMVTKSLRNF